MSYKFQICVADFPDLGLSFWSLIIHPHYNRDYEAGLIKRALVPVTTLSPHDSVSAVSVLLRKLDDAFVLPAAAYGTILMYVEATSMKSHESAT